MASPWPVGVVSLSLRGGASELPGCLRVAGCARAGVVRHLHTAPPARPRSMAPQRSNLQEPRPSRPCRHPSPRLPARPPASHRPLLLLIILTCTPPAPPFFFFFK